MIFLFWGSTTMAEFSHQHKVPLTSTYTQNHANQKQNCATKAYFLAVCTLSYYHIHDPKGHYYIQQDALP